MHLEFGDVVLVGFPFTDQFAAKHRPALVVSNATYNAGRDIVVMAITEESLPTTPRR